MEPQRTSATSSEPARASKPVNKSFPGVVYRSRSHSPAVRSDTQPISSKPVLLCVLVNSRHPAYDTTRANWLRSRDFLFREDAVKADGEKI